MKIFNETHEIPPHEIFYTVKYHMAQCTTKCKFWQISICLIMVWISHSYHAIHLLVFSVKDERKKIYHNNSRLKFANECIHTVEFLEGRRNNTANGMGLGMRGEIILVRRPVWYWIHIIHSDKMTHSHTWRNYMQFTKSYSTHFVWIYFTKWLCGTQFSVAWKSHLLWAMCGFHMCRHTNR